MPIRLVLDQTGSIEIRRLSISDATITATALLTRLKGCVVPPDLLPRFKQLNADFELVLLRLDGWQKPTIVTLTPEPTSALLDLLTRDILTNPRLLNYAIDQRINNFEATTRSAAKRPEQSERGQAGRLLQQSLFPDGLRFLTLPHAQQWLVVKQRFAQPDAPLLAAATTLGIHEELAEISALNDYFGRLLGITEEQAKLATPPDASALNDCHDLFSRTLHLANLAWEGSSTEAITARQQLLEPYLDKIQEIAKERSKLIKLAKQKTPPPPSTTPSETPTP